jgi:hypothetical protein
MGERTRTTIGNLSGRHPASQARDQFFRGPRSRGAAAAANPGCAVVDLHRLLTPYVSFRFAEQTPRRPAAGADADRLSGARPAHLAARHRIRRARHILGDRGPDGVHRGRQVRLDALRRECRLPDAGPDPPRGPAFFQPAAGRRRDLSPNPPSAPCRQPPAPSRPSARHGCGNCSGPTSLWLVLAVAGGVGLAVSVGILRMMFGWQLKNDDPADRAAGPRADRLVRAAARTGADHRPRLGLWRASPPAR